ncbi:MAG TPA: outer membrane beta-barrel protein [Vicinamibacterales bacterium]|nr:outer membrane beta-barrel protein [Vicinamibacterales bacterium]
MTRIVFLLLGLTLAAPAAAQDEPSLSIRPFFLVTDQSFAAVDTFDAAFGKTYFPFFGGGGQVVFKGTYFVEITASRFQENGERSYFSGGKAFKLGIPLTATITPIEVTGGYRFRLPTLPRVRPYVAAGFGSYGYQETSSFADAGDNVDTRHAGFVVNGGAEFRLHRWIGVAVDVQYTHIPGILGTGGVSQQTGESDLGGVAARFKAIVGR